MVYITFLACLFIGSYTIFTLLLYKGWLAIPEYKISLNNPNSTYITVIIPVRNEENNILNILKDIENQDYSYELFEVYFVNDCSTDNTEFLINKFIETCKANIKILNLPTNTVLKSPKKTAITTVINLAKGELILTTDGDCSLQKSWLTLFSDKYQNSKHKIISGPVTFLESSKWFYKIQTVEFSSLIAVGAASIQLNMPNMCNGANLAFEKSAFQAVDGYNGFENQPSGDDEFLLHKIANKYPNQIGFIKNKEAIVCTNAQNTLLDFINQRLRWASKWSAYKDIKVSILALFVFLVNILTICGVINFLYFQKNDYFFIEIIILRYIIEILFLTNVLKFLNRKNTILFIPLVQLIYSFYVVFIGLISQFKTFKWKDRIYKVE